MAEVERKIEDADDEILRNPYETGGGSSMFFIHGPGP